MRTAPEQNPKRAVNSYGNGRRKPSPSPYLGCSRIEEEGLPCRACVKALLIVMTQVRAGFVPAASRTRGIGRELLEHRNRIAGSEALDPCPIW